MLETLTADLEGVEIPAFVGGALVLEVEALVDLATALLSDVLGRFDASEAWDMDPYAATSCRTFLTGAADRTGPDAQRQLFWARWCAAQPVVLAALRTGELSAGQGDAIRSNVPKALMELFAEHASWVVPEVIGLSVTDTVTFMLQWNAQAEATLDPPEPVDPPESLFVAKLLDGRRRVDGQLDAMHGKTLEKALELADSNDFAVSPAARRAQAMADVCKFFLDHQEVRRGRRNRPHFHLVLDAASGTATHLDGEPILRPELETLLCDATIQRILAAGSVTIDLGHEVREVSTHIWDTIAVRDQHCRFDGHCAAKPTRCDAHHVVVFPAGVTAPTNLILLCEKHHRRLHRPGWHGRLDEDGVFHVNDPHGRTWTTYPNGPSLAEQARTKQERKAKARAERQQAERQQAKARQTADDPNPRPFPFTGAD